MNEVTIFQNEQFGEIRTSGTADNPLFCLSDICKVLELDQPSRVKSRLNMGGVTSIKVGVQTGTKKDGTPSIQEMDVTFINEQNLYKVIMRSDKPQAEAFQDWVCGEVLPSIRKTGGYLGNVESMSDEEIMAKALVVAQKTIEKKSIENKVLKEENVRLESENVQLALENQELRHDKNYLDLIMRSKALLTISQIAQDYGMSGKALNKILADMGIQYSLNGQWILYAKYKDKGFVSSRSIDIVRADGRPDIVLHTEWTQAGRKFLYEELKKKGIIPMLERN
jgi:prophage antirepressor-like protein